MPVITPAGLIPYTEARDFLIALPLDGNKRRTKSQVRQIVAMGFVEFVDQVDSPSDEVLAHCLSDKPLTFAKIKDNFDGTNVPRFQGAVVVDLRLALLPETGSSDDPFLTYSSSTETSIRFILDSAEDCWRMMLSNPVILLQCLIRYLLLLW